MKKLHPHWIIWLILLIVSLLPLFDLFNSGLPITHDGKDHVARIANFYQSLSEETSSLAGRAILIGDTGIL